MTNDMMPGPMEAKPGQGDLAESFQEVLADIDPAEKMPKPVPDSNKLGAIREDTNMMLDRLDRMAGGAVDEASNAAGADIEGLRGDAAAPTEADLAPPEIEAPEVRDIGRELDGGM
jgi:hypothetical protein